MKRITLKPIGVGRYDDVSPFIITDTALELCIAVPNVNGEFYFAAENNGKSYYKLIPKGGLITLPDLTAGELCGEVTHYLKGERVKNYKIEPLIIKEADGTLTAEPEFAALKAKLDGVEKAFGEFRKAAAEEAETRKTREKTLADRIARIEGNLLALAKFAYEDYNASVYLEGGTAEKFTEAFGLRLTDEELEIIKGEK